MGEVIKLKSLTGTTTGTTGASKSIQTDTDNIVNGWNNDMEKLLQKWILSSCKNSSEHEKLCKKYKTREAFIIIPTIILSTVSSLISFIGGAISNNILYYLVGGITALSACLAGIAKYLNYTVLSEKHFVYYTRFNDLTNKLKLIYSMDRDQRPECIKYMKKIEVRINKLQSTAPLNEYIPQSGITNFSLNKESVNTSKKTDVIPVTPATININPVSSYSKTTIVSSVHKNPYAINNV